MVLVPPQTWGISPTYRARDSTSSPFKKVCSFFIWTGQKIKNVLYCNGNLFSVINR